MNKRFSRWLGYEEDSKDYGDALNGDGNWIFFLLAAAGGTILLLAKYVT